MVVNRPSHKELTGKLRAATDAVLNSSNEKPRRFWANDEKILPELDALDLETEKIWKLILDLIQEIMKDPMSCYDGRHPPKTSYEPGSEGCDLYSFSWESEKMGVRFYFKFAIKDDKVSVFSIHDSKYQFN